MIEKRPELFKIECLSKLRQLFACSSPFFAGYGNRQNDLVAYEAVGIPRCIHFLINKTDVASNLEISYEIFIYIVASKGVGCSSSTRWASCLDRSEIAKKRL